jgi:hypothetical protein
MVGQRLAILFSPSLYESRDGGGAFLRRRVSDLQKIPPLDFL